MSDLLSRCPERLAGDVGPCNLEDRLEPEEVREKLCHAIGGLSDNGRIVFILRDIEELDTAEKRITTADGTVRESWIRRPANG